MRRQERERDLDALLYRQAPLSAPRCKLPRWSIWAMLGLQLVSIALQLAPMLLRAFSF